MNFGYIDDGLKCEVILGKMHELMFMVVVWLMFFSLLQLLDVAVVGYLAHPWYLTGLFPLAVHPRMSLALSSHPMLYVSSSHCVSHLHISSCCDCHVSLSTCTVYSHQATSLLNNGDHLLLSKSKNFAESFLPFKFRSKPAARGFCQSQRSEPLIHVWAHCFPRISFDLLQ